MTLTASAPATRAPAKTPSPGHPSLRRLLPLAPALVLIAVFLVGPILWSVWIAFTNETLTGSASVNSHFVGLDNFTRLFGDDAFTGSLVRTLVFVLFSAVLGQNVLGLLIALVLRGKNRAVRGVVNGVVIAAWVVPEVVAAACWFSFLDEKGTLNSVLGIHQEWLVSAPMLAVILANTWRGTAFSMLVYSAALSEVPRDVMEAAKVDGASTGRTFFSVTLPLIQRSVLSNLMLTTLQTLASFGLIYALTGGGPGEESQTTPLYMYEQAFKYFEVGYGSAIALVMLLFGGLLSLVYLRLIKVED
ncbi:MULTISPECIES: carbohydrate ABC transporter permease [unclassified Streptomyces]|uniref:carbohydrate ABC transporter permease n=1 Tax=unclassified Streptomyces TaxID=2593676 RepID=UPI0036E12B54